MRRYNKKIEAYKKGNNRQGNMYKEAARSNVLGEDWKMKDYAKIDTSEKLGRVYVDGIIGSIVVVIVMFLAGIILCAF